MFEDNIIADTGHGSHLRPTEACAALGNGPARGFGFECKEMLRMVKVFDSPVPAVVTWMRASDGPPSRPGVQGVSSSSVALPLILAHGALGSVCCP